MSRIAGVTLSETSMQFRRIEQWYASTIGSRIHQIKMQSGAGIVAMSFAGDELQKRSYPASFGGQHQLAGYELIESLDLVGNAPRVAEEAVALHKAAQCPEGERTIILEGSQLGLQVHESVGHPIELDRVLGMEANFAGMSFLTLEKLGKLRYASDIVNVVADARLEHGPGLGTFGYDDEGVPAQCTPVITNGLFTGYLSDRETAPAIGLDRSGGTMRAESWNRLPMIRMTNISLLPGAWRYDDLIADTDDAILMATNRSWSIDDRRYHFQFSTEIGWEIKSGKRTRMLKNPSYSGITTEFWNSCDAICSRDHWTLWGTPNCGKGQPMQTMGTGHGAAPSRFRNIRVTAAATRTDCRQLRQDRSAAMIFASEPAICCQRFSPAQPKWLRCFQLVPPCGFANQAARTARCAMRKRRQTSPVSPSPYPDATDIFEKFCRARLAKDQFWYAPLRRDAALCAQ